MNSWFLWSNLSSKEVKELADWTGCLLEDINFLSNLGNVDSTCSPVLLHIFLTSNSILLYEVSLFNFLIMISFYLCFQCQKSIVFFSFSRLFLLSMAYLFYYLIMIFFHELCFCSCFLFHGHSSFWMYKSFTVTLMPALMEIQSFGQFQNGYSKIKIGEIGCFN